MRVRDAVVASLTSANARATVDFACLALGLHHGAQDLARMALARAWHAWTARWRRSRR